MQTRAQEEKDLAHLRAMLSTERRDEALARNKLGAEERELHSVEGRVAAEERALHSAKAEEVRDDHEMGILRARERALGGTLHRDMAEIAKLRHELASLKLSNEQRKVSWARGEARRSLVAAQALAEHRKLEHEVAASFPLFILTLTEP